MTYMPIKTVYYKGCRVIKSRTDGGAEKWLLYMSREGGKLQDTFPNLPLALDYIDEKMKAEKS